MNRKSEIILGIDPGTIVLGYGVIEIKNNKPQLLEMGVLKLSKYKDANVRLQLIYNKISELHRVFKPTQFAIEAPFFGKNVQSMLKLGRAQGVAMAAGLTRELPIYEYSPKRIKQSITGNGNASKEQVALMLERMLKFKETPEFLDATDGLAAAVCHYFQAKGIGYATADSKSNGGTSKKPTKKKKTSNWSSFIAENPGRIQAK